MSERELKIGASPLVPTRVVKGAILEEWERLGGVSSPLGYPTANEITYRDGGAQQRFQRGVIAYHPEHGAHYICGKFYYNWDDQMGVNGPYMYPTDDPYECGGVTVQHFWGGSISSDMPEIRDGIDLRGEFRRRGIEIRNQGARGTCSVHAMVAVLDFLYSGLLGSAYNHLSVEYANHFGNVAADVRSDGHYFSEVAAGYDEFGIVPYSIWPYNREWTYDFDAGQRFANEDMINTGRQLIKGSLRMKGRFIKEIDEKAGLSREQFDDFISVLDSGIPVAVGRDHSLCAVGYRRYPAQPGGGIIIFRNSWGTNPDFTGYQTETFENIINTVFDIYSYTLSE